MFLVLLAAIVPSVAATQSETECYPRSPDNMVRAWIDPGDYLSVSCRCNSGDVFYGELHLLTEGVIQFFVCDEANFDLWHGGESATLYGVVSGVRTHTWKIQVPHDGRWIGVMVSEEASQDVRVSASYHKASQTQILVKNVLFTTEIGLFVLIGILSVGLLRSRRDMLRAFRVGLETEIEVSTPGTWLRFLRRATAVTLVLQSVAITAVVVLAAAESWDPGSPYNGFTILYMFYLIPLFVPLLCARNLFLRRQCKGVLMLWSLPSLVIGNHFLMGWFGGGGSLLLAWALAFALPTWLYIAFTLSEAIALHTPSSMHSSDAVTLT
jgi:hypothetical protein